MRRARAFLELFGKPLERIVPTSTIHTRVRTPLAVAPAGETIDERLVRVRQQPGGYYWLDEETGGECGPFECLDDALADMNGEHEEAIERSETIEEAEQGPDRVEVDVQGADDREAST
jgi:hypothetical protein